MRRALRKGIDLSTDQFNHRVKYNASWIHKWLKRYLAIRNIARIKPKPIAHTTRDRTVEIRNGEYQQLKEDSARQNTRKIKKG